MGPTFRAWRSLPPDTALLRRAAEGDATALELLRQRHFLSLYALAYGIVMDPAAADDVVTATFLEAQRRAAQCDSARGSVRAWLSDLARRHAQGAVQARDWPQRTPAEETDPG